MQYELFMIIVIRETRIVSYFPCLDQLVLLILFVEVLLVTHELLTVYTQPSNPQQSSGDNHT